MAITHSIKFTASAKDAIAEIGKYQDKIVATAQTVDKHAASLGGSKIIQQAHNWTAAVDKIGGATKLTGQEQAKVNAILEAAITKYRALGQQAPTDMTKLYEATKKTADVASQVQSGLSGIMSKLGPLGPMIATTFTVGAITSFVKGVVGAADQIQKMSDRTGDTAARVQELQYIAGQTGTSFDGLINASQELQKRLGEGDDGVAKALKDLGLNAAEIGNMGATEALYAINTAMTSVGSETDRARIQSELFGKAWKDLAPAMRADMQALAEEAPKMADATVAALDKAGDRWDWLTGKVKVASAELLNFSFEMVRTATAADFWQKSEAPILRNVYATRRVAASMLDASGRAYQLGTALDRVDEIERELTAQMKETTSARDAYLERVKKQIALEAPARDLINQMIVSLGNKEAALLAMSEAERAAADAINDMIVRLQGEGEAAEVAAAANFDLEESVGGFPEKMRRGGDEAKKSTNYYKLASDALGGIGRAAEMSGHKTTAAIASIAQTTVQAFAAGGPWAAAMAFATSTLAAFGSSWNKDEERNVNDMRDAYIWAAGGIEALDAKARALGVTLDALLSAKTAAEYDLAIRGLTAAFGTQADKLKEIARLEDEIFETRKQYNEMAAAMIPGWDQVNGLIEKYGLNVDGAGQKIQQLKVTSDTTGLVNAWETLTEAGGDATWMLGGMADEFSNVFSEAVKYGSELPAQMKPILEALVAQGLLVDENGTALKDLGTVKFGEPVKTEMEKAADALALVADKIDALVSRMNELAFSAGTAALAVTNIGATTGGAWTPYETGGIIGPSGTGGVLPGFARGVRNFGGGLALVGERGPEIVGLPRGSNVYPNGTLPGIDALTSEMRAFRMAMAAEMRRAVRDAVLMAR